MAKDKTEKPKNDYEISLKAIKDLGGVEDDLKLIENVQDDEEEILLKEDFDTGEDTLSKGELLEFIKGLNFKKIEQKLIVVKDNVIDEEEDPENGQVNDYKANQSTTLTEINGDQGDALNEEELTGAELHTSAAPTQKKIKGNKYKKFNEDGVEIEGAEPSKDIAKVPSGDSISKWGDGPPNSHKVRNYMLVKPNRKWFENELAVSELKNKPVNLHVSKIHDFENYAKQLLQNDVALYKTHQFTARNRSNFHWIETVLKSGTTGDKMAAYIVLIQDSPVHNLATLERLIKLVDVRGKKECLMAADTLKDLFITDLLLENKKLNSFEHQPIGSLDQLSTGNRDSYDKLLLLWYFESCLKLSYTQFLTALGKMAHDTLEATKHKAINVMFSLLTANPEQEQILLKNVVNKVGDPHPKVASQSSSLLCRLTNVHPNMKAVVVAEVEMLLFRPNLSAKASYYAVCFINQLILDHREKDLAAKLIFIYFCLFKVAIKKGEVNSKMMSALLTGVNRAFPYAKLDTSTLENQINATYKIIHTTGFSVGLQALMLIYHVLDAGDDLSDRFYCALYRKLLDPELKNSSKQAMFLNLLYKSLKRDQITHRVHAFIKRIFQIALEQHPGMICALLFLVSEVLKSNSNKLMLESNQIDSDDEDEILVDFPEEDENDNHGSSETRKTESLSDSNKPVVASWVHRANLNVASSTKQVEVGESFKSYNPQHRNPLYAGAGRTCAWELVELSRHHHPSVAMFANTLLEGKDITYGGDPLQDFTLTRFLDRFVYRNPKKLPTNATNSVQGAILGKRKRYVPSGAKGLVINSANFLRIHENAIPVDERFFHKYLVNNKHRNQKPKDEDDEDGESIASDEFEMLLDRVEPGALKDEYDLDFASEVKAGRSKKKAGRGEGSDDDEDDDEEMDFGEDDDFDEAFKDFDEDIKESKQGLDDDDEFDGAYEDFEEDESGLSDLDESDRSMIKRRKLEDLSDSEESVDLPEYAQKPKRSKEFDPSKLFVSAEEFSAVLDENTNALENAGGLEALANRDNAHVKQLRWEHDRDRWVRGVDWKSKMKNRAGKRPAGNAKHRIVPRGKAVKTKKKMGKK